MGIQVNHHSKMKRRITIYKGSEKFDTEFTTLSQVFRFIEEREGLELRLKCMCELPKLGYSFEER